VNRTTQFVLLLVAALVSTVALTQAALAQETSVAHEADKPYWPTRGWRFSTPEAQGMDSEALAQAFDYIRHHNIPIHSLLIARNGYVVLDAYFYPFPEGQVHDGASTTKSITTTVVGIAIGEHKLKDVHEPVLSLFATRKIGNRDPRKERMTIEHLLSMTSGLDCHREHAEITLRQMDQSEDWIQFMLDLPMIREPGTKFEYCSGGMHLLSGVISAATGASALDFARRELFQPLGIEKVIWPADPQGNSRGWGDIHLEPRDMAKIGYLWLNQGRWEGRQIVPSEWMQQAMRVKSHPDFGSGEYGYGFWVYPKRNPPEFEALGRGGQRISVIPEKNLVVVFTGGGFEPGDIGKFIGDSLKSDHGLPANPAAAARLATVVRAAADPPPAVAPMPMPDLISGKKYVVESNPLKLKSFSLVAAGKNEAAAEFEFADGRVEHRPIGLDGIPRLSAGGRYGLPVALQGRWETSSAFIFDYDEVSNINCYHFRLTFDQNDVSIEVKEKTGLVEAKFHGKSVLN
jgi:CubicO group peptidase (beta-lactamase class C family)